MLYLKMLAITAYGNCESKGLTYLVGEDVLMQTGKKPYASSDFVPILNYLLLLE